MAGGLSKGVRRAARELTTRMVDDARGRRVRLVAVRAGVGRLVGAGNEGLPSEVLARVVERLRPTAKEMRKRQVLIVLGAVIVAAYGEALARAKGFPIDGLMVGVVVLAVLHAASLGRASSLKKRPVRIQRVNAARVADAIVAEEFCASCGQDLRGLPRAADGCTVCPECGSAWRVPAADSDPSPASP